MHVSIMIFSYTIFIVAGLISFILIIQKYYQNRRKIRRQINLVNRESHQHIIEPYHEPRNFSEEQAFSVENGTPLNERKRYKDRLQSFPIRDLLSKNFEARLQNLFNQWGSQRKYQLTSMNLSEIKKNCHIGTLQK